MGNDDAKQGPVTHAEGSSGPQWASICLWRHLHFCHTRIFRIVYNFVNIFLGNRWILFIHNILKVTIWTYTQNSSDVLLSVKWASCGYFIDCSNLLWIWDRLRWMTHSLSSKLLVSSLGELFKVRNYYRPLLRVSWNCLLRITLLIVLRATLMKDIQLTALIAFWSSQSSTSPTS